MSQSYNLRQQDAPALRYALAIFVLQRDSAGASKRQKPSDTGNLRPPPAASKPKVLGGASSTPKPFHLVADALPKGVRELGEGVEAVERNVDGVHNATSTGDDGARRGPLKVGGTGVGRYRCWLFSFGRACLPL